MRGNDVQQGIVAAYACARVCHVAQVGTALLFIHRDFSGDAGTFTAKRQLEQARPVDSLFLVHHQRLAENILRFPRDGVDLMGNVQFLVIDLYDQFGDAVV